MNAANIISWFVSVAALVGNYGVVKRQRWGFGIWVICNLWWVAYDISLGAWAQAALFAAYAVLAAWGWVAWGSRPVRASKETREAALLHKLAMALADQAQRVRMHGEVKRADILVKDAFAKEKKAALLIAPFTELEPTRSVLLRSAASLALECGETAEASILVERAFSGNPPKQMVAELNELLADILRQTGKERR